MRKPLHRISNRMSDLLLIPGIGLILIAIPALALGFQTLGQRTGIPGSVLAVAGATVYISRRLADRQKPA